MKKIFSFLAFGLLAVASASAQGQMITERPEGQVHDNMSRSSLSFYTYLQAALPLKVNGLKSEVVIDEATGDFYLYNPLTKLKTDTYMKGKIDAEGNVTFPTPQYIFRQSDGTVINDYYIFRMHNVGDLVQPQFETDRTETELKFTWKDGTLTQTDGGVLGLGFIDGTFAGYADENIKMETMTDTPVVPANPEALDLKEYIIGYTSHHGVAECVVAKMAFDGSDAWLTDFVPGMKNIWIKGQRLGDEQIMFESGQYLGVYDDTYYAYFYGATASEAPNFQGTPETIYILEADIMFDASSKGYFSDNVFEINAGKDNSSYLFAYTRPQIDPFEDKPMVPRQSAISIFIPAGTDFAIGMLGFVVDPLSVNNDFLDPEKLFYTIYINDEENPLVLKHADFPGWISEDTSIIPYRFNDGTNDGSIAMIFNFNETSFIYSNLDWKAFGIQTVYTGGNEINKSPIVWTDGRGASIEGIDAADDEIVEYFNLSGQKVSNPEKGIYIVRTASGKTFKKIVK